MDEVKVAIASTADILTARQQGRQLGRELGLSSSETTLVATGISELARNILLYAVRGQIVVRLEQQADRRALVVIASDEGPGIDNLDDAMRDGYSTSGGLGLGLPSIRRFMDDFDIVSTPGVGTTVTFWKWKR